MTTLTTVIFADTGGGDGGGQIPEERALLALPAGDHRTLLHRALPDLLGDGQHDPGTYI